MTEVAEALVISFAEIETLAHALVTHAGQMRFRRLAEELDAVMEIAIGRAVARVMVNGVKLESRPDGLWLVAND